MYQNQYNQQMPQTDGALGWGDQITQENQFVLLPAGDYRFEIKKFERGNFEGSEKISACPKAIITFEVTAPDGSSATLTENYLLHTKMEWKLSEFFAAIGMKQKGQPAVMQWSQDLIGKTGVCKVIVHKYKKDGEDRETNRIDKLYPSYDQPVLPPPQQIAPPPQYQTQYQTAPPQYQTQPQTAPPPQYSGGWQNGNF